MTKRRIWRWVKVILLVYGVLGIVIYHTQDHFIWHPQAVPDSTRYDFGGQPHSERTIPYDSGTRLDLVEFRAVDRPADSPASGVVLFFHGNRHDVEWYGRTAADFTRDGYETWIWDYPGFGKSTGAFSEQKLYDYALQVYKLARSRWPPSSIVLYGRSMGCGIASQLADVRDCKRLILESPFYSLPSLGYHYLPVYPWGRMLHYHFPVYSHLPEVTAPVTIFAGTADRTFPYSNASRLKRLMKPGDEFITIEGAGHNDLRQYPLFRRTLDSVLKR
ncbi:MAG TPA: alpha/beta fold hydrolase [Puia sp.]|nr:alpha/beta fold hydrolase [Puia sp.]